MVQFLSWPDLPGWRSLFAQSGETSEVKRAYILNTDTGKRFTREEPDLESWESQEEGLLPLEDWLALDAIREREKGRGEEKRKLKKDFQNTTRAEKRPLEEERACRGRCAAPCTSPLASSRRLSFKLVGGGNPLWERVLLKRTLEKNAKHFEKEADNVDDILLLGASTSDRDFF
jgi:hypothetical protein